MRRRAGHCAGSAGSFVKMRPSSLATNIALCHVPTGRVTQRRGGRGTRTERSLAHANRSKLRVYRLIMPQHRLIHHAVKLVASHGRVYSCRTHATCRLPCRDDGSNGGERHASNATTASTGGYSCWHFRCSRVEATCTRDDQLSSSIGRHRMSTCPDTTAAARVWTNSLGQRRWCTRY